MCQTFVAFSDYLNLKGQLPILGYQHNNFYTFLEFLKRILNENLSNADTLPIQCASQHLFSRVPQSLMRFHAKQLLTTTCY